MISDGGDLLKGRQNWPPPPPLLIAIALIRHLGPIAYVISLVSPLWLLLLVFALPIGHQRQRTSPPLSQSILSSNTLSTYLRRSALPPALESALFTSSSSHGSHDNDEIIWCPLSPSSSISFGDDEVNSPIIPSSSASRAHDSIHQSSNRPLP
ncbi:unnamed protein product [Linum trigynum]|uniref:Uncharacterized protein n=1 Tax=Linum trigynum TaxID=586398 RepID=A0AAV2GA69_9ROSI